MVLIVQLWRLRFWAARTKNSTSGSPLRRCLNSGKGTFDTSAVPCPIFSSLPSILLSEPSFCTINFTLFALRRSLPDQPFVYCFFVVVLFLSFVRVSCWALYYQLGGIRKFSNTVMGERLSLDFHFSGLITMKGKTSRSTGNGPGTPNARHRSWCRWRKRGKTHNLLVFCLFQFFSCFFFLCAGWDNTFL